MLIVSDFAAAEFAFAIARRVRMKQIVADDARGLFATFDAWTARETGRAQTTAADVAGAAAFLRRLDRSLRTADALNIAIAQRIDADLLTFDDKVAASARAPWERASSSGQPRRPFRGPLGEKRENLSLSGLFWLDTPQRRR